MQRRMYRVVHGRLRGRVRTTAIHARRGCSRATGVHRTSARIRARRRRYGLLGRHARLERSDLFTQLILAVLNIAKSPQFPQ
jgi:hypothetical protein